MHSFLFSYFWCQTFHRCPIFRKPVQIRGLRAFAKTMKTKKKALKIIKNIHSLDFKNLPSFEVQSPGSGFWPNRILIPV